jgi:signal recognition particle receptor subunit beta
MVLINKAINEVTVKLVYYGPGLCGKTTNLEQIYGNPKLDNKGKMISMSTETDRTLFFDFMPLELGTVGGQRIRVQIYTVPGQVFYDATRKLVLRGADGVVFVADSQSSMRESNIESLRNLETNLRLNRIDPAKIALVYQYNKRDLPNVSSVEEMNEYMQPGNIPVVEAAAIQGTGVTQTLRQAIARILDNLKNNVDVTLYDAPPLQRPVMSSASGATSASAGVPKIAVASRTVERPISAPAVPPVVPPPAPAVRAEAVGMNEAPSFADLNEEQPLELDSNSYEEDAAPFESEPPFVTPFDPEPLAPPAVDLPFGDEPADEPGAEPFDPFAAESSDSPESLHALLASADETVRALETALERARRHRDLIAERLGEELN